MRNSCSAYLFTHLEHVEVSLYLNYNCGFFSPITLIQSRQHTQPHKEQSSFNNISILLKHKAVCIYIYTDY